MKQKRKAPAKRAWIGPACAAAVLVLRMTLPGAVSALRGVLIDSRGEKLTREVFEAFSGQFGSVPVAAPAGQDDRNAQSFPDWETEKWPVGESQEQSEEPLHG